MAVALPAQRSGTSRTAVAAEPTPDARRRCRPAGSGARALRARPGQVQPRRVRRRHRRVQAVVRAVEGAAPAVQHRAGLSAQEGLRVGALLLQHVPARRSEPAEPRRRRRQDRRDEERDRRAAQGVAATPPPVAPPSPPPPPPPVDKRPSQRALEIGGATVAAIGLASCAVGARDARAVGVGREQAAPRGGDGDAVDARPIRRSSTRAIARSSPASCSCRRAGRW